MCTALWLSAAEVAAALEAERSGCFNSDGPSTSVAERYTRNAASFNTLCDGWTLP
jgi:hypothetical protein